MLSRCSMQKKHYLSVKRVSKRRAASSAEVSPRSPPNCVSGRFYYSLNPKPYYCVGARSALSTPLCKPVVFYVSQSRGVLCSAYLQRSNNRVAFCCCNSDDVEHRQGHNSRHWRLRGSVLAVHNYKRRQVPLSPSMLHEASCAQSCPQSLMTADHWQWIKR